MSELDLTMVATHRELITGRIKFISEDNYHIIIDGQLVKAKQSFSCLLTPLVDDLVLLFNEGKEYYILSIIQRLQTSAMSIKLGENLSITSENNQLKLQADTLVLTASQTIQIKAPKQEIQCEQGHYAIKHAEFHGQELSFTYESLKMICDSIQTISDTINTQAVRVYQWVTEMEHQLLGRLRTIVKHNYRIDCDQIDIYADGDAKIAAKQIHLG